MAVLVLDTTPSEGEVPKRERVDLKLVKRANKIQTREHTSPAGIVEMVKDEQQQMRFVWHESINLVGVNANPCPSYLAIRVILLHDHQAAIPGQGWVAPLCDAVVEPLGHSFINVLFAQSWRIVWLAVDWPLIGRHLHVDGGQGMRASIVR